ncbi:MAG: integrase [Gammaproteobacteria bacterium HGW-Gammaproteobacteria-11]|nr:MAG: integrase [Gammaproteobacteria bacterium HGW-Gammaproteobacteria-11]
MKRLTDKEVKALKTQAAEAVGGRGDGALVFKRRDSQTIEAYYQYFFDGKRQMLKLGRYGQISLAECRAKATDLAAQRGEHPDLKGWLAESEEAEQEESRKAAQAAAAEAQRGSLQDLLQDYASNLLATGTTSAKEIARIIRVDFIDKHPDIVAMKARDIEPEQALQLLAPVWERGAKTQYNRARTYLHAAFQYGLQAEYDIGRKSRKVFGLVHNPVAAIRKQPEGETAHERALTDAELHHFWHNCIKAKKVGELTTLLLQFVIATGGQRPYRLIVAPWPDYDLQARTVRTASLKGRGKARVHLIPLTDRAIEIMLRVKEITGHHPWPWSFTSQAPINISTPRNAVIRFCDDKDASINKETGERVQPFTPRDLRRTAKQIMQRAGIEPYLRDLLQDHNQGGIANKHYANNPDAAMPDKWRAINAYDQALNDIISIDH